MQHSYVNFAEMMKYVVFVRQILNQLLIAVCLVSFVGITIQSHSCLTMNKTEYSLGLLESKSCCSSSESTNNNGLFIVKETCCSNHSQTIKISSSYSPEKQYQIHSTLISSFFDVTPSFNNGFAIKFEPFTFRPSHSPPLFIKYSTFRC